MRTGKTHYYRRTRIQRWLGQENEEKVARTINCYVAGLPSLLKHLRKNKETYKKNE